MRRIIALAAAGLVAATTVAASPAADQQRPSDPTFNMELELGDSDNVSGENAGINPWNWVDGDDYHCEDTAYERCEVVLVKVTNPFEEENAKKGRERANLLLGVASTVPAEVQDFAIRVWESDEDGGQGELVGSADGTAGETNGGDYNEQMNIVVTTDEEVTERYYRVEVIFWSAAGDWHLDAEFIQ
jgi:hypothetical protein